MLEIPDIKVGTHATVQKRIKEEDTSINYGSGKLKTLLSTPALVALMIKAAVEAIDDKLPEEMITVGKMTTITHDKPTGLGAMVSVKVEVKSFDGQKIVFDVTAYDEIGTIAQGTHERIIVNRKALLKKAQKRAEKLQNMDY